MKKISILLTLCFLVGCGDDDLRFGDKVRIKTSGIYRGMIGKVNGYSSLCWPLTCYELEVSVEGGRIWISGYKSSQLEVIR